VDDAPVTKLGSSSQDELPKAQEETSSADELPTAQQEEISSEDERPEPHHAATTPAAAAAAATTSENEASADDEQQLTTDATSSPSSELALGIEAEKTAPEDEQQPMSAREEESSAAVERVPSQTDVEQSSTSVATATEPASPEAAAQQSEESLESADPSKSKKKKASSSSSSKSSSSKSRSSKSKRDEGTSRPSKKKPVDEAAALATAEVTADDPVSTSSSSKKKSKRDSEKKTSSSASQKKSSHKRSSNNKKSHKTATEMENARAVKKLERVLSIDFAATRDEDDEDEDDVDSSDEGSNTSSNESEGDDETESSAAEAEAERTTAKFPLSLVITLKSAVDLYPQDLNGLSDPYCELLLRDYITNPSLKTERTSVQESTLEPVWNESFTFEVADEDAELQILCWDQDHAARDDFEGAVYVNIAELVDGLEDGARPVEFEFEFGPRKGRRDRKVTGALILRACFQSLDRQTFTKGNLLCDTLAVEQAASSSEEEDDEAADSAAASGNKDVVVVMVPAQQANAQPEVDEATQIRDGINRLMERARLPPECAANLEMVARLVRTRSNRKCADCNSTDLCAVSSSLGIFLCDPCALMHHRVLPVYVSRVHALPPELLPREIECSLPEDLSWLSDTSAVIFLSYMGNRRANKDWEAQASQAFTSSFNKPAPDSNEAAREKWIKGKYLMALFASMVEGELDMTVQTGKKLEKKEVRKRWARLKKNGLHIYPSISHPEPERVIPMNGCMVRLGGLGEPSTFEMSLRNTGDAQAAKRAAKSKKSTNTQVETIKFNAGKSGRAMQWVFALGRAGCNIINATALENQAQPPSLSLPISSTSTAGKGVAEGSGLRKRLATPRKLARRREASQSSMSNLAPSTTLLSDCISQIAQRGLDEEGIFRVNGSASQIKELKRQYHKNRRPDLSKVNIHTVAGLLKSHFKDSQRPLISVELYADFCSVLKLPENEQAVALQGLVRKLDDHNQMTLQTLLLFLNEVAKHVDQNGMDLSNLSKMFGPSLLRDARQDARQAMSTVNDSIHVTELLLEHQEVVFEAPPVMALHSPRTAQGNAPSQHSGGAFPGIKLRAVVNEPSKSVPSVAQSGKGTPSRNTSASVAQVNQKQQQQQQQQQQQKRQQQQQSEVGTTAFPGINFHQVETAEQLQDTEDTEAAFPGIALHTSEGAAPVDATAFPGIKMHTAAAKPEAMDRIKLLLAEQEERERAERIRRVREREAAEAAAEREAEQREKLAAEAERNAEERLRVQDEAAREPLLASNFRLADEQDRKVSLVLDPGSYTFRAGFNVGVAPIPQFEFRNSVQSVSGNIDENGLFASYIAGKPKMSFLDAKRDARQHVADLFYPMRDSVVTNWEHHDKVLDYFFNSVYAAEATAPEFDNVVYTISPLSTRQERERIAELLFETYDVSSLYLITDSVGSLYSAGLRTGLVVESGPDNTRIVPIYHGCVVEQAVSTLSGLGGRAVTDYLESKLRAEYAHDKQVQKLGTDAYQTLKHELCYVAADYEAECKRVDQGSLLQASAADRAAVPAAASTASASSSTAMELLSPRADLVSPRGGQCTFCNFGGALSDPLDVTRERFKAAEGLFKPSFLGVQSVGLHQGVFNSLAKITDVELRTQLCANIVLAGGGTLFPGLAQRLQHEVQTLIERDGFGTSTADAVAGGEVEESTTAAAASSSSEQPTVCVNGYYDREAASWHGAALFSSTVGFNDTLLAKEEFLEVGPNLLHWKMIP